MRLLRKNYPLLIITVTALTSLLFMLMIPGDTKAATQCSTKDNYFYYTTQGSLCGKVEYPASETMYFSPKNKTFTDSQETSIIYLKSKTVGTLTYYYKVTVKKSTPSKGSILYRKYDSRTDKLTTITTKAVTMQGTAHWKLATPPPTRVTTEPDPDPGGTGGGTNPPQVETPKEVTIASQFTTMFGGTCTEYSCWIKKVWAWGTAIMVPISIIILVAAGGLYAASGGNPDKITLAKQLIWGVVSGLLLIVLGYVILINFVGLDSGVWVVP